MSSPGGSNGSVTGIGGTTVSAKDTQAPLNDATQPDTALNNGASTCPLKKHTVKVLLKFKDDGKDVPSATCKILKGTTEVNAGPLSAGSLSSSGLDAGTYEVTFPDIDASEWAEG